jgi:putative ABC transport system permease protein
MGASVKQIVFLLSRDITVPILGALIIGAPIAYFSTDKWLMSFAYRMDVSPWTFVLAGTLLVLIAWMTVSSRAIKAATLNPVDAFRRD